MWLLSKLHNFSTTLRPLKVVMNLNEYIQECINHYLAYLGSSCVEPDVRRGRTPVLSRPFFIISGRRMLLRMPIFDTIYSVYSVTYWKFTECLQSVLRATTCSNLEFIKMISIQADKMCQNVLHDKNPSTTNFRYYKENYHLTA